MKAATATTERAIADAIIAELKHVKTVGPQWYVYKNGIWQDSRRDIYRPIAYRMMAGEWKAKTESAALTQVEGRQQCDGAIFRGALTSQDGAMVINTKNCILMVTGDSIRQMEHNREFYFTRAIQVDYDATAPCPRFRETYVQSLPDVDDQHHKHLLLGNTLYHGADHEAVEIDIGEAGTGKSTLAEPVMGIMGSGEGGLLTSLSLGQICDPNCYALAKLRYALVNLGTELQSLAIDESETFKKIISGEPFEARPIYSPPFTMTTFPKLWFLANNIPRFKNGTDAELRRAHFVTFGVKPEKPDKQLKSYLREHEQAGVFNFMLEGLQMLMREGTIPMGGKASRAIHDRFRVSNDTIKAFIDERCVKVPSASCSKEAIGNAYTEFCEQYSLPFKGDQHFFQKLYDRFPEVQESKKREGEKRIPSLVGVGLKTVPVEVAVTPSA